MMKIDSKPAQAVIRIISLVFVVWSAALIYRSSFIALDGRRYFSLFDDAMISMRYAWNFSHGLGLIWNAGERIQGYTNLLMTLLMSLATLIFDKSMAVLSIQIIGILFMLVIAYLTVRIADHLVQRESAQRQSLLKVIIFFCVLFYYPLVYWSVMGMETGLLTVLLLAGLLFALDYTVNPSPRLLLLVALCLGLAYLTRNDSLVFAFLIGLYILWHTVKAETGSILQLLPALGLYLLFVVGQAYFQYSYYGEFLPNTYTLKMTGIPLFSRIYNGTRFVLRFGVESIFILFIPTFDILTNFRKQKLLLLSIVYAAIAYQIYVGGDPWNYWRIMAPTIPLAFLLYIFAINRWVDAISTRPGFQNFVLRTPSFFRAHANELLVIAAALIALYATDARFLPEISLRDQPHQAIFNRYNTDIALALNEVTTDKATYGVLWAGALPYYTDRKAIDFLGKSDKYIANLPPDLSGAIRGAAMLTVPGHNKYDLNYSIKTLQPTYIQEDKWGVQDLTAWRATHYVSVDYKGVYLFLLKNSPEVLWDKIDVTP